MALFTIKSHLIHKFNISFGRCVITCERHIRGRPRSEFLSESNDVKSKMDEEWDDHELPSNVNSVFRKDRQSVKPDLRGFDERSESSGHQFYDSRNNSNYDKFDKFGRAKQGFNDRNNYQNYRENYNQREKFWTNNRNEKKYERNDNNNRFDQFRSDRNYKQNNYRNEYFDNRSQRSGGFDNRSDNRNDNRNRYSDRKQSQEYQNFKYRKQINEFGREDNAIYNVNKDLEFDDQRPRFSRFRENEFKENKKQKRMQRFEDNSNEINVSPEDIENTGEEETEQNLKKINEKIPLPFKVTAENRFEVLNQIVTPLHLKPYDIQLGIKYRNQIDILRRLGKKLKLVNCPVICDPKGLPCPLELVKPSPITERYRNKDEFSIWPGVDGNNKTVGFFIGQPSIHDNVVCVEPDHIIVSKESHLSVAKKFQTYLNEMSPYESCQNYGEGGHWRRFHIRSNNSGQHMISAQMHPQELTQQELDEEMQRLRQYFEGDERIVSMYFQPSRHTRLSNEREPFIHLFGDKNITETLSDKKFILSVDSFFQINSSAAQVLYRNIMSELNVSRSTTVLDICCGIGTFATLIAPNVCRVIGIDSSVSAIADAQRNAALNNVTNATFVAGKVEEKLPQLIDELYSQDIVVVANPTRGGLHSSVINSLRGINFIRKVVYVSCKPEGNAFKNFLHLCVPANKQNQHLGSSFVPTNAIPVDMFPHTNHCELILTFERF